MKPFEEKYHTIDDMKSSIDCMVENFEKPDLNPMTPMRRFHYHDYIELLFSIDSDAIVWINEEHLSFKKGEMIIINSNNPHSFTFIKPSRYIVVKFSPDILHSEGDSLFELKYIIPFLEEYVLKQKFTEKEIEDLPVLFNSIIDEWTNRRTAYELSIKSSILRIFTDIFRYWEEYSTINVESNINDIIKKSLVYISENFNTVTEKSVAEYCNYSCNYFSLIFKKSIGKNFHDYLLSIKLKEAERKLVSSNENITNIAVMCGFSSSSHFISCFKSKHGITPLQFRKKFPSNQTKHKQV